MKDRKMTSSMKKKAAVDWNAIHRRLTDAQTLADKGWAASARAVEQKKILKERARNMAQEPPAGAAPEEQIEIIEFLLAYERYAIELSLVREVYPLKELTTLPGTRPFVVGIVNIRGQIVSIIDLKKFFDLPEKGLTDLNKVIVLDNGTMTFGLLVDAVYRVHRISRQEIEPSLPTLTGIRQQYLRGVTSDRLIILDGARILTDPRVTIRDAAPD